MSEPSETSTTKSTSAFDLLANDNHPLEDTHEIFTAPGKPVNSDILFVFALVCNVTLSGGLLNGNGPLMNRLTNEDLVPTSKTQIVFDGAFQMLTGFTLFWSMHLGVWGPRVVATLGTLMACVGNLLISVVVRWSPDANTPYWLMIGYGLVGGGGNGIYLASFNLVFLFKNKAFRTTIFATAYGVVGFWYVLLSVPSVPLASFFLFYGVYAFIVGVLVMFAFPSTAYGMDSVEGRICFPCVKPTCIAFPITPFYNCKEGLKEPRFWAFLLCFSWCANCLTWVMGAVLQRYPDAGDAYRNIGFPFITNAVFLINPFIGKLIDKSGFVIPALLNVVVSELLLVCFYFDNIVAQWLTLVLMMLLNAFTYSIQVAYITLAFPGEMFPGLLFVTVLGQFALGFLAVFLSSMPWGRDWTPYLVALLTPTVIMYIFPFLELKKLKKGGALLETVTQAYES